MKKLILLLIAALSIIAWTPVNNNLAVILGHSNTSDWISQLPVSAVSGTYSVAASLYVENCCTNGWAIQGDYTGQGLPAYEFYNPDNPAVPLDLVHPWNGMWALSELDWLADSAERDGDTWPVIYDMRTQDRITPHWEFLPELKPKWVFVNCEFNDLWRQYHPSWHNGSLQSVRDNYLALVDKIQSECPTCEVVIMVSNAVGYERPQWMYDDGPPAKYKPLLYYGEVTSESVEEHNCNDYQTGACTSLSGNPNEYDGNDDAGDCFLACAEYFNPNHYVFSRWAMNLAYNRGLRFVSFFDEVGRRFGLSAAGLNTYRDTYLNTDGCPPLCVGCTDTCVRDSVHIFDTYKNVNYYNQIIKPALTRGFRKNKASFTASQ